MKVMCRECFHYWWLMLVSTSSVCLYSKCTCKGLRKWLESLMRRWDLSWLMRLSNSWRKLWVLGALRDTRNCWWLTSWSRRDTSQKHSWSLCCRISTALSFHSTKLSICRWQSCGIPRMLPKLRENSVLWLANFRHKSASISSTTVSLERYFKCSWCCSNCSQKLPPYRTSSETCVSR